MTNSFLYFFPDVKTLVQARPLLERLSPYDAGVAGFAHNALENAGPGGKTGSVFMPPGGDMLCGYYPERQTWREFPEGWIGWETLPGPADLVRAETVGGYPAEMGDGQEWTVPIARRWPDGTGLPRTLGLDVSGGLSGEVLERYRTLWARATEVWNKYHTTAVEAAEDGQPDGTEPVVITFSERQEWDIAIEALAANYQVGPWEVTALRLLNERTISTILQLLIDLPEYVKSIKKKPSDG